ncbi:hypothetical protein Taro_039537 [Colocasia esculenta]|uniref:Uncharacterized protein n=1 Tax=Colocasia esculenta TaxID=4460 RepID=A0A843WW16_COLES|nr:hypothetical protein [Colocasia esculenta]
MLFVLPSDLKVRIFANQLKSFQFLQIRGEKKTKHASKQSQRETERRMDHGKDRTGGGGLELAGVDVDVEGEDEDGEHGEEDDGVNEDGFAVGPERPEFHVLGVSRDREQQPRRQQHEQHHPQHYWRPVRHRASPAGNNPSSPRPQPSSTNSSSTGYDRSEERTDRRQETQYCGGRFLPPKPVMTHHDPSRPIKAFPLDVASPCCATSPRGSCKGSQEAIALARAPPSSRVALTGTSRTVRSELWPTERIPRLGVPQPYGPGHCPGRMYRTANTATGQWVATAEQATFFVFIVKSLRAASSHPHGGCNCRRPRAPRSKSALTAKHSNGHTRV